jgi:hypothetical protein
LVTDRYRNRYRPVSPVTTVTRPVTNGKVNPGQPSATPPYPATPRPCRASVPACTSPITEWRVLLVAILPSVPLPPSGPDAVDVAGDRTDEHSSTAAVLVTHAARPSDSTCGRLTPYRIIIINRCSFAYVCTWWVPYVSLLFCVRTRTGGCCSAARSYDFLRLISGGWSRMRAYARPLRGLFGVPHCASIPACRDR